MAFDNSCTGARKNKDYDWAFDLRAQFYDSSESEDDVPPHPITATADNSVLLKEFDLSSREEFVSYKSNPFTIAKVNAAYRSAKKGAKPSDTSVNTTSSDGVLTQSKITDGFKVQASKRMAFSNQQTKTLSGKSPSVARTSVVHTTHPSPKTVPQEVKVQHALPDQDCLDTNAQFAAGRPLNPSFLSNSAHMVTQSAVTAFTSDVIDSCSKTPASTFPIGITKKDDITSGLIRSRLRLESLPSRSSPLPEPVAAFRGRRLLSKHDSSPLRSPPRQSTFRPVESRPATLTRAGHYSVPFCRLVKQKVPMEDQTHIQGSSFPPVSARLNVPHPPPHTFKNEGDLHKLDIGLHGTQLVSPRPQVENVIPLGHSAPRLSDPSYSNSSTTVAPPTASQVDLPGREFVNATRRMTPVTRKRSTMDAYDFCANDSDENWSTLPSRKKNKLKSFSPYQSLFLFII
jgi:hypothetical protein